MNSQPIEMRTIFSSLCSQDPKDIWRSKISSILFPHLRYFAYFIARGVLACDNTSNSSAPDVAILANTLSGESKYNVRALIARLLAANGNKGNFYGGVYATHILESLERTPHPDDEPFTYLSFDLAAMKSPKFVTRTSEFSNLNYILRFGLTTIREIRLPAPPWFDYTHRSGWSFNDTLFDEFVIQEQFHNPMEGVVPNEEEHGEFPPFMGETVTQ